MSGVEEPCVISNYDSPPMLTSANVVCAYVHFSPEGVASTRGVQMAGIYVGTVCMVAGGELHVKIAKTRRSSQGKVVGSL